MGVVLKFEAKRSISFDFIAYSVIKDFEQKICILCATPHPKIAMNFERNHLKYIKSQKVLSSAYLRLDSVEENIEGDANLHHTPPEQG